MNVFFRADGSNQIGAGHIVRCLTLADALAGRGAEIAFICRQLPCSLAKRIRSHGHELIELHGTHVLEAGPTNFTQSAQSIVFQEEDAQQTKDAMRGRRCNWLIVDHYALDCRWERIFRSPELTIFVIDDLANRVHECDLLLDQNYYANLVDRYKGLLPSSARCLLGPQYALLRPEFAAARENSSSSKLDRLFVSVGATDRYGICLKAVESLRGVANKFVGAELLVGTEIDQQVQMAISAAGLTNVNVYSFRDDIATVMARCTLAIGAGGSSTWERCAMGLPSIVFVTADNQREMVVDLAQTGIIAFLGEAADASVETLSTAMTALMHDPMRRSRMRADAMNLVDGQGARRVTERVLEMTRCTD